MLKQRRGEMPFLDHLEELRWRIFKAVGALVVGTGIGFYMFRRFDLAGVLIGPAEMYLTNGKLQVLSPADPFFFIVKTSILLGIILSFPVIVYQIWAFLAPALEKRERRIIIPSLVGGMFLFAFGVWGAYVFALPVSLQFLAGIEIEYLQAAYTANDYLSFVVRLLLAFGLLFELPVVVLILSAFGLVTPKFLRAKRRHAMVIITVLASFLSPGDLVMVTVVMMIPMVFLYEVSILLSVLVWRGKDKDKDDEIKPPGPADSTVEMDR